VSLADPAAICYVPGAKAMGVNADEYKRLQTWIERMRRIPRSARIKRQAVPSEAVFKVVRTRAT